MLRIAVPNKGSLSEPAVEMLREAGYRVRRDAKELVVTDTDNEVEFFYLRPRDIAVYVGSGTVDCGITGRDLLLDSGSAAIEVMTLGFGGSTFRYAARPGTCSDVTEIAGHRVATSYPGLVEKHLAERGVSAEVVRLDGAVETAITLGVADVIADVVETGTTLRQAAATLLDVSDFDYLDPELYQLTLPDGRSFVVRQGKGLQSLTDLNGNRLTVSPNGIQYQNPGVPGSSTGITFVRDTQGRIASITDPLNNVLEYTYDPAGDLVEFEDREDHATTFTYHPSFPHHLLSIVDPLGRARRAPAFAHSGRCRRGGCREFRPRSQCGIRDRGAPDASPFDSHRGRDIAKNFAAGDRLRRARRQDVPRLAQTGIRKRTNRLGA